MVVVVLVVVVVGVGVVVVGVVGVGLLLVVVVPNSTPGARFGSVSVTECEPHEHPGVGRCVRHHGPQGAVWGRSPGAGEIGAIGGPGIGGQWCCRGGCRGCCGGYCGGCCGEWEDRGLFAFRVIVFPELILFKPVQTVALETARLPTVEASGLAGVCRVFAFELEIFHDDAERVAAVIIGLLLGFLVVLLELLVHLVLLLDLVLLVVLAAVAAGAIAAGAIAAGAIVATRFTE